MPGKTAASSPKGKAVSPRSYVDELLSNDSSDSDASATGDVYESDVLETRETPLSDDDAAAAARATTTRTNFVDYFEDTDELNQVGTGRDSIVGDNNVSVRELGAAHEELLTLSEALSTKAQLLASREKALNALEAAAASERTRLSISSEALEQRAASIAERELAADARLREESDALQQDLKLAEQRIRLRFEEEAAEREGDVLDREAALQRRCESSAARFRQARESNRRAEEKMALMQTKMAEMHRQVSNSTRLMEELSQENSRLKLELDVAKKKCRVQNWKFEKHLSKQQDIAARLDESQRFSSELSLAGDEVQEIGAYLLLLIDGLVQLVAPDVCDLKEAPTHSSRVIPYRLFVHSLLPGLCHAVALNEICGSRDTCKRLLVLVLYCVSNVEQIEQEHPQQKQVARSSGNSNKKVNNAAAGNKEENKKLKGLVDRYASRLLRQLDGTRKHKKGGAVGAAATAAASTNLKNSRINVGHDSADEDRDGHLTVDMLDIGQDKSLRGTLLASDDAQVRSLSSMASLCVHMLKKPVEPGSIVTALVVLSESIPDPQCQQIVLSHPAAIEPILLALRNVGVPAWRVCAGSAIRILFQLSAKGPFQGRFVELVSEAPSFYAASIAVFDSLTALGRQHSSEGKLAHLATTCEAASIVAVFLQRLSTSGSGKLALLEMFRHTDLIGILQECLRVAKALEGENTESGHADTLRFFAMNAEAVSLAIKKK